MQLQEAVDKNRDIEDKRREAEERKRNFSKYEADISTKLRAVADADNARQKAKEAYNVAVSELASAETAKDSEAAEIKAIGLAVDSLVPIDTTAITGQIATAEEQNKKVRENLAREVKEKAKAALGEQFSAKGKEMDSLEFDKAKLLHDAKVPVEGLSVAGDEVVFNGIPVSNLSTAEKIRVGSAIAVAQNPKAKIILCDDVSLLDSTSLKVLHETCKDFQVWQVFNDESKNVGIYIESGEIKAKEPKPEAAAA
jgi:hypothetical protein